MARRFAWLLPGFFISGVLVLWKAHEQQLKGKQVLGHFPEEMPIQIEEKLSAAESPSAEIPYSFVETDQRFQQDSYFDKISFSFQPPLQGLCYIRLRLQHIDLCCTDEQPQSSRKSHHGLHS